jgi:hypothetical protein
VPRSSLLFRSAALLLAAAAALALAHPWLFTRMGLARSRVRYEREAWGGPSPDRARVQMLDGFLAEERPVGKRGKWIADLSGEGWLFRAHTDGFSLSLGRYPHCPLAAERWLWVATDERGIVTSLEVLDAPRDPIFTPPAPPPWRPVPLAVVPRIEVFRPGRIDRADHVLLAVGEDPPGGFAAYWLDARLVEEALELDLETWTGDWTHRLGIRLSVRDGEPRLEARHAERGHTGSGWSTPMTDVHGVAAVEQREPGSGAPLRVRVHLAGIADGFLAEGFQATSFEADVEIAWDPLRAGSWSAALAAPRDLDAIAATGPRRPVEMPHPRGGVLALGELDAAGRRQGVWHTRYAGGARRTATLFVDGLPDGPHRAWSPAGDLRAEGRFAAGRRSGAWATWTSDGALREAVYADGEEVR